MSVCSFGVGWWYLGLKLKIRLIWLLSNVLVGSLGFRWWMFRLIFGLLVVSCCRSVGRISSLMYFGV